MDVPIKSSLFQGSPRIWRYALPNENYEGWAVVHLDEYGFCSVISDYGDYSYHWPRQSWGPCDFRKFLLRCDEGYLTSKFAGGQRVLSASQTRELILQTLQEGLEEGSLSAVVVEEERELLESSDFSTDVGFYEWSKYTQLEDSWECACYTPPSQLLSFMERVWPRIKATMAADLEFEKREGPPLDLLQVLKPFSDGFLHALESLSGEDYLQWQEGCRSATCDEQGERHFEAAAQAVERLVRS
jgi:hypothetical protein